MNALHEHACNLCDWLRKSLRCSGPTPEHIKAIENEVAARQELARKHIEAATTTVKITAKTVEKARTDLRIQETALEALARELGGGGR